MQTKKVLFIIGEHNFATTAIKKNLEEARFEVVEVEATVEDVEAKKNEADIFLYYLSSYLKSMLRVLELVASICKEGHKTLFLVGEPMGLEAAKENTENGIIDLTYSRPLDIRVLVSDMKRYADAHHDLQAQKIILLVDDDPDFLKLAQGWFKDFAKVDVASSGTQAIDYLNDYKPDLILLDYNMPGMSGSETMDEIRQKPQTSQIPIIFLTGRNDRESVMKVLDKKPDGYILKSMARDDILKMLEDFFANYFLKRKTEVVL